MAGSPDIDNILLDRDGTLIEDRHYLSDPNQVSLFPDPDHTLARLGHMGLRFFLVTNQSGIGRGYFSENEYQAVQKKLKGLLEERDVTITATAFCPHAPEHHCACRKPETGLWLELKERFSLEASRSIMVGDKQADIRFGLNAGLKWSVLVLTGYGQKTAHILDLPPLESAVMSLSNRRPDWPHILARDLSSFAGWLTGQLKE